MSAISAVKPKTKITFFRSLRGRLILFFLGVSLIPLIAAGAIAYVRASQALNDEAQAKLEAIRTMKNTQIESYFQDRLDGVKTLSANPAVIEAMRTFDAAIEEEASAGENEADVMNTYRSMYKGNKDLADAGDGSAYSAVHAQYHPIFKQYLEAYGYYDIFLVELHSGAIQYTVGKEEDYGTSLKTGPYADTSIADIFKQIVAAGRDETMLVDFAYYEPSKGVASFVGSPIFDGAEMIGVLIFQLPIDHIDTIMQERTGMGESGETYLVGADKLMRSNSRFSEESTILTQKIDAATINKALNGQTGFEIMPDYRGVLALSAYEPLQIKGVHWVLLSKIDKAEAYAPAQQMLNLMLIVIGVGAAIVLVVAIFTGNSISKPVIAMTGTARKLAEGDFNQAVEIRSRDEMGAMADAFREMLDNQKNVIKDIIQVSQGLAAGDLSIAPKVEYPGDFAPIKTALSATVAALREAIEDIVRTSQSLAAGDLRVAPEADYRGDLVQIKNALVTAVKGLNGTMRQTTAVAEQVVQSVEQVRSISQDLAANAQEQSSAVEQITSNMAETDSQVKANAENANVTNQLVSETADAAGTGQKKMKVTTEAMDAIAESARDIAKIIKVIDEIAFQTNLLALNAAVEAARAGQHGRGFAVVAQEVRNLAGRSAKAAKETAELIEDTGRRVEEGVTMVGETAASLDNIVQNVVKVKDLAAEIAAASEEQTRGLAQISDGMVNINQGTQGSSQQSEELASTADELGNLTDRLREEVNRFKLAADTAQTNGGLGRTPASYAADTSSQPAGNSGSPEPAVATHNGGRGAAILPLDRDERGYADF